jgi:hypothetical protein
MARPQIGARCVQRASAVAAPIPKPFRPRERRKCRFSVSEKVFMHGTGVGLVARSASPRRCSRRRGVYHLTALPVQGCRWLGSVTHGSIRNRWSRANRSAYHPFGVFASRCRRTDERRQEPVWPAISQSVTRPSRWRGLMTRPFLHPAANAHRQSVKDAFPPLVQVLRNALTACASCG